MKKLLYVYQNYRKSYSSASLSILRGLKKAKVAEVDAFEVKPLSFNFTLNRVLNRLPFIRDVHFKRQNNLLFKQFLKTSYDYLFIMKGTDIKASTLKKIKQKSPNIQLICFNPDDPFNLASSNEEIIKSIKIYDYYCIWTTLLNEKLYDAGAKKIIYFPFGVDEEIVYPVDANKEYDISFIGNGDEERHRLIQELSIELMNRNLDYKVHVFGSNWPNIGDNVIIHSQRNGEEMLRTIAATKININLLRRQNKNSINMRTFEIPAAGGFMMHEESVEAENFFDPNKEVVYFKTVEDLVDVSNYFLSNENERQQMIDSCSLKLERVDLTYSQIVRKGFSEIFNYQ